VSLVALTPSLALVAHLNAVPAVASALPGRVWLGEADQQAVPPFAVVAMVDTPVEAGCQGSPGILRFQYLVFTYAPTVAVAQLTPAAVAVHEAVLAVPRDTTLDGWRIQRVRWRRAIERPLPEDGVDPWLYQGGLYEIDATQ
jgi:hypothetical protein